MDLNISKYRKYTKAWDKRVSLRLKAAAPVRQAADDRPQGSPRVQEDYKARLLSFLHQRIEVVLIVT